jgi:predicted ribosome quality control (RQC) complex YloA/Tae2 family protein
MNFRKVKLPSGTYVYLGKDAESNDELMKKFEGKENTILHTLAPGSPFCVIDNLEPTDEEISLSGAVCVRYSQDWRDNKKSTKVNVFTGKDISKNKRMQQGTWKVENAEKIKIKKSDIKKFEDDAKPDPTRKK